MSEGSVFKVPLTTILKVEPHNNAHSLDICTVYGFQVITQKGKFSVGDKVIYIPIDSIIPQNLEEKLFTKDSKIKLNKSRVRQIKIRGLYSQGMLISVKDYKNFTDIVLVDIDEIKLEEDISTILGITKYEPPAKISSISSGPKLRDKPFTNPYFRTFNGISNLKWFINYFKDEEVVIQSKVHGCIRNWEEIELVSGEKKTIQEIVDNKLNVEVWGFDHKINKIVPTKILGWANNGITKDWLKVKYTKYNTGKGSSYRSLEVTPNHKFFVSSKNEYVNAENLKPGDKVLFKRENEELTYIQEQILIGKMLGDGSLTKGMKHISFGHKKEFESYLDYTLDSLGEIGGNRDKNQFSGYGTEMVRGRTISSTSISEFFEDWFIENKKQVPKSIIDKIGPIALAFWYMDDGSLSYNESQEDRVSFAVCGFNEESVNNLLLSLKKFNITGIKYQSYNQRDPDSKHWRIRLNADEAEKFFLLVATYIHPSMRYKITERYRDFPFIKLPVYENKYKTKLIEQEIIEVEKIIENKSKNCSKYDIETETHNFFINGILVHNSHIRFGKAPFVPNTLWKKIKQLFKLNPTHECVYGSNNVELTNRKNYTGFYGENIYGKCLEKYKVFDKIKNGEFVHGEIYGLGIQANYDYGAIEHKLIIFDVRTIQEDGTQKWLNPEEAEQYAKDRGFDFVPVLYKGIYDQEIVNKLTTGPDPMWPKHPREGIVIKSRYNYDNMQSKRALKSINPDYLADDTNTDDH